MKIITVGNLKGGTGKTTSTVNLAYSMSLLSRKVLVIDADPQTNLTPFFTKANQNGYTVRHLIKNEAGIGRAIYRSKYKNIDILKGDPNLKESDVSSDGTLAESLGKLGNRYDVCLIDTRPVFEQITQNALYASELLITPVLLDKFCRDNLLIVEDELHGLGMIAPEWKIFANKVENKRAQRNTYADMVEKHSWTFLETCISKGAVVENALELYKPVIKHRSSSQIAQDYIDLAQELLAVLEV